MTGRVLVASVLLVLCVGVGCDSSSAQRQDALGNCDPLAERLHLTALQARTTTAGRVTAEIREASTRQFQDPDPQPLPTAPWSDMDPSTRVVRCALGAKDTLKRLHSLPPSTLCPPEQVFNDDSTFDEYVVGPRGEWTKVDPIARQINTAC